MPKAKYQRPTVKLKGIREKRWVGEYREYFIGTDGKEQSRHKSASWPRAAHTKGEAQAKLDALILALSQGGPKADGSLTLSQFWEAVYLPIRRRRWTGGTETCVTTTYRAHILPTFGNVALRDITKASIQIHLGKMADRGLGHSVIESVRARIHSIMEEALDNDYVPKNPARKVETPACKPPAESRSLTEAEIRALWSGTEGMDRLWWRILILTGARPGELFPLERADMRPDGLMIDQALVRGTIKLPKRNKIRLAPLPDSLRAELEDWLAGHSSRLLFPTPTGLVHRRDSDSTLAVLARARLIVPGITFRQCRTTFATHFEGDAADRTSIMGHTSEAFTLDRYRKPLQERRQNAVEELDQRLRSAKVVPIKRAG